MPYVSKPQIDLKENIIFLMNLAPARFRDS